MIIKNILKKVAVLATFLLSLLLLNQCHSISQEEKYLLHSAGAGKTEISKRILQAKGINVNINVQDEQGATPLMYAIYGGHFDTTQYLIKAGAKLDLADNNGRTALLYAIFRKRDKIASLLIKSKADVNVVDNEGQTPLMYLVKVAANTKIAKLVIQAGANLDVIAKKEGITALMMACFSGKYDMVRLLLKSGANPNLFNPDNPNLTPLRIAQYKKHKKIVKLLKKYGAE